MDDINNNNNNNNNANNEESSEDEYLDPYLYVREKYGDLMDELYVKPSRWRLIYEMTGRLDIKFKGCRQMGCQLEDVRKSKLKFIDEEKTKLSVKNSTNNLIFLYQSKKLAATSTQPSNSTASSSNVTKTTVRFVRFLFHECLGFNF